MASIEPRHDAKERARRQLAVRLLLDWLADFDGGSWHQRWTASGADAAGRSWSGLVQFRGINKEYRTTQMMGAVARLILLDAIRPSYSWLYTFFAGTLYGRFREIRDPDGVRGTGRRVYANDTTIHPDRSTHRLRPALPDSDPHRRPTGRHHPR